MPSTEDCFGPGWHFGGDGRPALFAEAGGPFTFDVDGRTLLKLDDDNTYLNGSGEISDRLHFAVGTGFGTLPTPIAFGPGDFASTLPGGGNMNTPVTFAGTNVTNPFATPAILTLFAHANMELTPPNDPTVLSHTMIQLTCRVVSSGDPWAATQEMIARSYSNGDMSNSSWMIPFRHVIGASATLALEWQLVYTILTGGDHARWSVATAISTNWEIHRA